MVGISLLIIRFIPYGNTEYPWILTLSLALGFFNNMGRKRKIFVNHLLGNGALKNKLSFN